MNRFYLPAPECRLRPVRLTGREAHHALDVLRLRRGDRLTVLDGEGTTLECTIQAAGRAGVELAVERQTFTPRRGEQITLLQAIPKGKILEAILQRAVELGADRVVPLLTERVVTRLAAEQAPHKAEKLQHIAIESIKQCGSPWLPKIEAPTTPQAFLSRDERFDLPLIASLQPGSLPASEYFRRFRNQQSRQPTTLCVWVGPEGDFTPGEVRSIEASGVLPITLGPLVLRVETAATYCLSILRHELQVPGLT